MFSIIIPTYNEAGQVAQTIRILQAAAGQFETEIIIADGGSSDDTISIAQQCGAIILQCERKGRAAQMNKGASVARYNLLYFLHADSIPPKDFTAQILAAIDKGAKSGSFRLTFDYDHWFLKANAWFTRFDVNAVRFGDQSLFVVKKLFDDCGGFREDLWMMEDQEIIHRLKQSGKFVIMKDTVITSARKYQANGIYRMQAIFFRIWFLYYLGCSQKRLLLLHKRLIRKNKL